MALGLLRQFPGTLDNTAGIFPKAAFMDEASSRFVDQLVLEKLVNEKLARVHHQCLEPIEVLLKPAYHRLKCTDPRRTIEVRAQESGIWIQSEATQPSEKTEWYRLVEHRADHPRGAILLVHGLYEENRAIYGFLIGELVRRGYSVYLTTLPYHYERTPNESRFGGEYFFSANLLRTKHAFERAAAELAECHGWLSRHTEVPLYVVGFSMGATVALALAGLTQTLSALTLINPAAGVREVLWTSPLSRTIRADLVASGLDREVIDQVLLTFDPCAAKEPMLSRERIQLIYGAFDQVTLPIQYQSFAERWGLSQVKCYRSGHLNVLRVPRLADEIVTFFNNVTTQSVNSKLETLCQ